MKKFFTTFIGLFFALGQLFSQSVNVDVNLNMKHSVDGVSNFGRERRMTIHSSLTEGDWTGHEDKLDYIINDLDVYFGRETGSATWKMHYVEEDPNKPGWASEAHMKEHGAGLNQWYESDDYAHRHQYESKSNMIMGTNSHTPMYPHLSYYDGFGRGEGGWYVKDTDAAADWVGKYLDNYFAHSDDAIGEKLPTYWECSNEPDMDILNASFGMIVSSLEKNWEYHKLVAEEVRTRLGDKAPKIGGMCWGQLDLYKPDAIPSRVPGTYWDSYSSEEAIAYYTNMLKGVGEPGGVENPGVGYDVWPKAWDNKGKDWWQWDYMYQGFIDFCGTDMDFYAVHMYDWPSANSAQDKANTRGGGHTEATLDLFEWYDNHMFNSKKEIVLSEFGAVSRDYILSLPNGERDWPFIKSFNQMQMQFLERPSHVTYSMPFAPVKATWGATFSGSNITRYEGATLMEPRGTWTGNPDTWEMNEPTGGWHWSKIIHFFELWKDVEGTRIETKSSDNDVQVDAYVLNNHVYLILNNTQDFNKTLNLNIFGENGNSISNVEFRHLYKGDDNIPVYTVADMKSAPAQVTLKPNSTIILDYTYASNISITEESKETKYMCEPLAGSSKNDRGTQLCHTPAQTSITATINNVQKPAIGEAIIRVGGFFSNPTDGVLPDGSYGVRVKKLTVNGNPVIIESDNFISNPRGYGLGSYGGSWFGVLEIECPAEYLVDGQNTVYFERFLGVQYTTLMIQAFDMTIEPGRTEEPVAIAGLSFDGSSENVMEGETLGLVPVFAPANTTERGLTWTSSNPSAVSVDENGVVTALANSGSAIVTATSTANNSIYDSITVNAIPFKADDVTGISIVEGASISVDQHVNTKLSVVMTPAPEVAPNVIWTTSDESVVSILKDGTIVGKGLGQTATVTATVENTNISDQITVSVQLADGETISASLLPDFITPLDVYTFDVPVEIMGTRTVQVELLKDGAVIATGTEVVDAIGDETASVTVNMSSVPAVATGYQIRLTLKNGATTLATKTVAMEMRAPISVTGVTLPEGPIEMVKLATKTLRATIAPADASDKRVTWNSNNSAVASIDENGKVKANAIGSAVITATTVDQGKTASITINVKEFDGVLVIEAEDFDAQGGPQANIATSDVGINNVQTQDYVEFNVYIPETGEYIASFWLGTAMTAPVVELLIDGTSVGSKTVPSGAWETYVEVTLDNKITISEGEHVIKVLAAGDEQWQWNMDKFTLTLDGIPNCDPITSLTTENEVTVGIGSTAQLNITTAPSNACAPTNVSWSTNDANIATVNQNGLVTGVAGGTATVTVTTNEGTSTTTVIVETIPPTGITVNPTSTSVVEGNSVQLTATVIPSNASNVNVSWSSNNTAVATVDANGLLTGHVAGSSAIITATTEEGNFTATCNVTVTEPGDDIVIEAESFTSTTGTIDDSAYGGPGLGVNNASTAINFVNSGDQATYSILVEHAGEYTITYIISTPSDNAQVQFVANGTTVTTNVPNNGGWDDYSPLGASETITLAAGQQTVTMIASGSNAWQFNLDKITLTSNGVPSNTAPVADAGADQTLASGTTSANLSGSGTDADNDFLTYSWTQSNGATVTINNASSATASISGLADGNTYEFILTVSDGELTATDKVVIIVEESDIGDLPTLVIQAEEFNTTGGTYSGFQTYTTADGTGAINWNQTGDWAEYLVNIPVAGSYEVSYYVGTTVNGAAVELYVDGVSQTKDNVVNNGNWDSFALLNASQTIEISTGEHTIKLQGAGTHGWEWNMDKFILAEPGAVKTSKISENISIIDFEKITVYPNPTSNLINISGLNEGSKIIIYNLQGKMYETIQSSKNREVIDAGSYPAGVYLIKVVGKNTKVFKINKTN